MNSHASTPTGELVLWMIDLLTSDERVRKEVRDLGAAQRAYVTSQPDLVLQRLDDLAVHEARSLQAGTSQPPVADLCRCVTIPVFFDWHLDRHVRATFNGPEDYRRYVESQANPGAVLLSELSADSIVFPAVHSWMIPRDQIAGLDGAQTLRAINAYGPPPLIIFVMPIAFLRYSIVRVRTPFAVDAIPKRNRLYSRSGLVDGRTELIDDDIPRTVVEALEWRP
jgi:hypothetical protein